MNVRFSPAEARQILGRARQASLATLMADGAPYASLVGFALCGQARPVLLLSRLAWHTQNLERDGRASLLVMGEAGAGDALAGSRISLMGLLARTNGAAARAAYLESHPEAEGYAGFADFSFWEMDVAQAHAVAGFGRIETFTGAELVGG